MTCTKQVTGTNILRGSTRIRQIKSVLESDNGAYRDAISCANSKVVTLFFTPP
nr:hypothetical protein [Anaeromassilibacillus sp. An172]